MLKQISVFLENKPGKLAELAVLLSDNKVNLRALSLAETEDFGIVRLIADDVYSAATVLRSAGYVASVKDVLAVEMQDTPGGLSAVLKALGENGINLEYMYAFTAHKQGCANMIFKVNDTEKAAELLSAAAIHVLEQDELADL